MDIVVNIELAGKLKEILSEQKTEITCLTITGQINAQDIRFIRDEMSNLKKLDIENAVIVEYFGNNGTSDNEEMCSAADTIPKYAFFKCKILIFKLPKNILSIEDYAFKSCGIRREFNDVDYYPCIIPKSVINIGKEAFCYSTDFWSLEIPASVKSIGEGAFRGCSNVCVEMDSPYFICNPDTDWILYDINKSVILHAPSYFGFSSNNTPTRFQIPNTVVKIDKGAFNGCLLNQIIIPKTLKVIGDEAFSNCNDLKIVVFDKNSELEYIGEKSFESCYGLYYINLPDSVTYIGDSAFVGCKLKFINIPSKINYIGSNSFDFYSDFKLIISNREIPLEIDECLFYKFDEKKIFENCILFVPADSVELYKNQAVWKKYKTILPIFKDNIQIFNTKSGELLSKLGDNLKSITKLTIKGFLNAIDFKTLRDELPLLSFLDISDVVIEDCSMEVETVDRIEYSHKNTIPRNAFYIDCRESNIYDFYEYYYSYLKKFLTNIILPKSLKSIGPESFRGCGIESIVIPNEVEIIENNAFSECDRLETVVFKDTNKISKISDLAFSNCDSLLIDKIPHEIKMINQKAFE